MHQPAPAPVILSKAKDPKQAGTVPGRSGSFHHSLSRNISPSNKSTQVPSKAGNWPLDTAH